MNKSTILRAIAIFFAIETLGTAIWPTLTYALTSGPTAPEATSFEPVDTTDMVNPLTGDLTYNIPLLEVPGPGGGYPLSLSYHAGIMPNEEASWVGLGWTLNPGAINRSVNGFADDHKNVENTDRFFWEGGTRRTTSIGISVGIPGTPASVSAGLEVGHDTYDGYGVGMYVGLGSAIGGDNSPFSVNGRVGVDPWGNPYASAGLGASIGEAGKEGLKLGIGVGVSTNFETVSGYASSGVSYSSKIDQGKNAGKMRSQSLLGASIATGGGVKPSLSVGGASSDINNGKSGNVSTTSGGFNVPIPTPIFGLWVNLGRKYQRYWIDETENVNVNGSLHFPISTISDWRHFDTNAYDAYSLLDPDLDGGIVEHPDADIVMGGSFPNVDNYNVNAQGLAGNIKPYFYKKYLARQNKKHINKDDKTIYDLVNYSLGGDVSPVAFRFINDFSNRHEYDPLTDFVVNTDPTDPLSFDFEGASITGENGDDGIRQNHLAGSKHIEYLTNFTIDRITRGLLPNYHGLVNTSASGFVREANTQIGAFIITNESGVKYHFALPAYAREEYQYSGNIKHEKGKTFNELTKPEKYAYTWYLTAITGPDFVDRGTLGVLDQEDWGYWVEFDYGKWTDQYIWRNPGEDMKRDLDANFENYSEGIKELYYLDAVKTKTHAAVFIKDIRNDGKSSYMVAKNIWLGKKNHHPEAFEGGYIPKKVTNSQEKADGRDIAGRPKFKTIKADVFAKPVSSLKLDKIMLVPIDEMSSIHKTAGNRFTQSHLIIDEDSEAPNINDRFVRVDQHYPDHVIDQYDIQATLESKAIRVIELDTDYSLAPETANSFSSEKLLGSGTPPVHGYSLTGKLTLNALKFLGKGGADLIPPTKFHYDLDGPLTGTSVLSELDATNTREGHFLLEKSGTGLVEGDLIKFSSGTNQYYALIKSHDARHFLAKRLGRNRPIAGVISWRTTKNPPYNKDAYDMWGMYKSDFDKSTCDINENFGRRTSNLSSQNVDAWSLNKVITNLGSNIKIIYESDSYHSAILYKNFSLIIDDFEIVNDQLKITIRGVDNLEGTFTNLDVIDLLGASRVNIDACDRNDDGSDCDCYSSNFSHIFSDNPTVVNVKGNLLTLEISSLKKYKDREEGYCGSYSEVGFIGGNISHTTKINTNGGGIRVSEILLEQELGKKNITSYDYNRDNGYTSGVTSYEPVGLDIADKDLLKNEGFKRKLYQRLSGLMANSREVPAPGVMYGQVKIEESVIHEDGSEEYLPSYSMYEFETFDEGMVGYANTDYNDINNPNPIYGFDDTGKKIFAYDKLKRKTVRLKDYTTQVGNLKSITLYDRETHSKISETINHYLHDRKDESTDLLEHNKTVYEPRLAHEYTSQGVIEETFIDSRYVKQDYKIKAVAKNYLVSGLELDIDAMHLLGVITKRETFPSIQTGQTNINYKTGITTTTKNLAFDFYSGQVTRTLSSDGYGNYYISETIPAYRKYPGMGLAINGGTHMLTQTAGMTDYKVKSATDHTRIGLVSASAQTWGYDIKTLGTDEDYSEYFDVRIHRTDDLNKSTIVDYHGNLDVGDKFEFSYIYTSYIGKVEQLVSSGNFKEYSISLSNSFGPIYGSHLDIKVKKLGIYKKKASYAWIGNDRAVAADGLYPYTDFREFTAWTGANSDAQWQKNGEITLYDVYSHALEAEDVNGKYAATKMDSKQERVLATVANAGYKEFAYSGAEDELINGEFGGDVELRGTVTTAQSHTGTHSVKAAAGGEAYRFTATTTQDRRLYASVWSTHSDGKIRYKINNEAESTAVLKPVKQAGDWYLLRAELPQTSAGDAVRVSAVAGASTAYFDDFRVHPIDAAMTSYVYNGWGELSHILDANNLYTEYRYDAMGRLVETYRESFQYGIVKTSTNKIHYRGQNN